MRQPGRYCDGMQPKVDQKIPDLVGLVEAGEILGMSKQAVHKRALKGDLAGRQVGTTWVFRRVVVEKLREELDQRDGITPG